jgi:hypothetical protein
MILAARPFNEDIGLPVSQRGGNATRATNMRLLTANRSVLRSIYLIAFTTYSCTPTDVIACRSERADGGPIDSARSLGGA